MRQGTREIIRLVCIILIVELVLTSFYILPSKIKGNLVLRRNSTTSISLWASHFVHENFEHFFYNSISFLTFASIFGVYFLKKGRIDFFYKLFLINLTIVPFVLSMIWIPVNRHVWTITERNLGFSGVLSSFIGSFTFADLCLLGVNRLYGFVSLSFFVLFMFARTYADNIMLSLIFLTITVIFSYLTFKTVPEKVKGILQKKIKPKLLFNFALLLVFFSPFIVVFLFTWPLFPSEIVWKGGYVCVYLHFVGVVVGMLLAFLFSWRRCQTVLF